MQSQVLLKRVVEVLVEIFGLTKKMHVTLSAAPSFRFEGHRIHISQLKVKPES